MLTTPLHAVGRCAIAIFLLTVISAPTVRPVFPKPQIDSSSRTFFDLGLEATDWVRLFQVVPPSEGWGISYHDSRAWGLDPYYYSNGTITSDTEGIKAGDPQRSAFLMGGHDAGLGAFAALDAYLASHDEGYREMFEVYYGYFKRAQLPSNASSTKLSTYTIDGRGQTVDESGYWAEQTNIVANPNSSIGNASDNVQLVAAFPAAEHGDPIAATLIAHYRLTHNQTSLNMLTKYANWLLRVQIKTGEYSGAFPVTQYHWLTGWKPRMYETTESAWILCELYKITLNQTYLRGAISAGDYMLSRQFANSTDIFVQGALPYEWNRTQYSRLVSTNHAGFTILAWTDLYRLTRNTAYLTAARRYADWLLNMQVTTQNYQWGDHKFANDSLAAGGYYYGYDTVNHSFGWRTALSLWSAAYAIPGLLTLGRELNDPRYLQSARMAIEWLPKMRFTDQRLTPLQALGTVKNIKSSYWGRYAQFYQPDWSEVEKAGIPKFVSDVSANKSALHSSHLTWFEQTYSLDFALADYEMASRGPQFMKMIWSWWPSLGFEPRYGADVAFGMFAMANFLGYEHEIITAKAKFAYVSNAVYALGENRPHLLRMYHRAQLLFSSAARDFRDGWYAVALFKLRKAESLTNWILPRLGQFEFPDLEWMNQVALLTAISVTSVLIGLTHSQKSKGRTRSRR